MSKRISWKKLFAQDGVTLVYEGYTLNGKPYGHGTVYYPDGSKYLEGLFDIKGLIRGKEYYENGQLRFYGIYKIHQNYGPNPPIYGKLYDDEGNLLYNGTFKVTSMGSAGYPKVEIPKEYGSVGHKKVSFEPVMWNDVDQTLWNVEETI